VPGHLKELGTMEALATHQLLTRQPHGALAAAWLHPQAAGFRRPSQVVRSEVVRRRCHRERRFQEATPGAALSSAAVMGLRADCRMRVPGTASSSVRRPGNSVLVPRASYPLALSVNADGSTAEELAEGVEERSVSVVLLSGGVGKRMGANMPKQYLPLRGQPIALYSFFTFAGMKEVGEIVVVCDVSYESLFVEASSKSCLPQGALKFARPGKERQDSVFSGLQQIRASAALVAVHDSARPIVSAEETRKVLADASLHGAAVLGVPSKATVKESDGKGFVARTLDRSLLWEMQTPQVMRPQLLKDGFALVQQQGLEVT